MKEATERELSYYRARDGDVPVQKWLSRLRDRKAVIEIDKRLRRLSLGNLGDHDKIGGGVIELRIHYGPGYRVYLGQYGDRLVILLQGGDKSSQSKDIELAKAYWADWKERET